jgi:hypothetical protein
LVRENFRAQFDQAGVDECWLWTGTVASGYGRIRIGARQREQAHRVSWMLVNGPIPQGLFVLHSCDVRRCVNPGHLFLGTQLDNMRDAQEKGRMFKLSPSQREEIASRRNSGESVRSLSREFGISSRYVWSITKMQNSDSPPDLRVPALDLP